MRKGIRIGFEGRKQEAGKIIHEMDGGTLDEKRVEVRGYLHFGKFTEPRYDIMGLFVYIPGMDCRHAVYSIMNLLYHQ